MLRFFVVVGFIYQFYYFSLFFLFLTISSSIYLNLVISFNRLSKISIQSPPYVTANADGEEWVLVNSWIQLMRWSGYYDNNDDDVNNNTDNDDGSNVGVQTQRSYAPPTSNNTCDTRRIPPPSLEYQMSLLADRTAFELADQFFAYLTPSKTIRANDDDSNDNDNNNNNFLIDLSWMPKRRQKRKQQSTTTATDNDDDYDDYDNIAVVEGSSSSSVVVPSRFPASSSISTFSLPYTSFDEPIEWQKQLPEEAKILSIDNCMVGDSVFYRHPGGIPRSSVQPSATTLISSDGKQKQQQQQQDRSYYYVPPMWLVGTILSFVTVSNDDKESNKLLRIRVRYPSQQEQWEVEVSHNCLMNGFYFAQQWMLPKLFCRAQIMLAKDYLQFLDCSSLVVNTPVRVTLYKNDGRNNDDDGDILTTREGVILDWRYFNWKNHIISCHPSDGLVVANTKYDELYFDELPVSIKAFARSLGYTKSSWDNDTEIPADTKDWDELTEFEKEAATMLGYVRQKRSTASVDDDDDSNDLNPFRIAGAVVPVKWNDGNQQSCLVPLKHIVYPEIKLPSSITTVSTSSSSEKERPQQFNNELTNLQRQTLFRKSLEASGKSIGNAKSILGTARLSAYWPEDGDFYDAVSIDEDDDALSLELLTSHFEFTLPGIYCPILYEDGEMHLTPISYIFKRGDQKRRFSNYVDDDSDSDEEKDQKAVSSSFPTEESINTMSTLLLDISRQTLSFGEHFSDIATQLEYASHLLHAAFEKKNKDDKRNKRTDQFEEPKNSIISLSATITANTTASNSTSESYKTCSNASVDDAEMTTTTTTSNNPTENKSYINYDWTDLPENIKNAAQRIGYNKKIWNTDGDLSINEKEWNDLNSKEQQDLKTIGYSEASWDMEDSSEDDDDDSDDSDDSDN